MHTKQHHQPRGTWLRHNVHTQMALACRKRVRMKHQDVSPSWVLTIMDIQQANAELEHASRRLEDQLC